MKNWKKPKNLKNWKKSATAAVLISCAVLAGCGAKKSADYSGGMPETAYATDAVYQNGSYQDGGEAMLTEGAPGAGADASVGMQALANMGRKLIKTVSMDVETEEYDVLLPKINARIEELGGYIENLEENQDRYGYQGRIRYASITARIPKEQLDAFVTEVAKESNVLNRQERVEDVTLTYVDLESHKKVLLAERERLMELLAKAETMEDIIAVESRLSEVRYQLESMESQLRIFDNQIDYSTVHINVSEVERLTPIAEESAWERIVAGFAESVYNIGYGIKDAGIRFLIAVPYWIAWGLAILFCILLLKWIGRACKKKKAKKREKMQKQYQGVSYQEMPKAGETAVQMPEEEEQKQHGQ